MHTDDPARIERGVAVAEERLPLEEIASLSAREHRFSPEWTDHRALMFVLQDHSRL